MTDTPTKPKNSISWFRTNIQTTPFHYEIEGALEVIVKLMQDARPWSFGVYDNFTFTVAPMHPDQREHEFVLTLNDTNAKLNRASGRIFQVSETTCILEGTIEVIWQPLYKSIFNAILISSVVALIGSAVSANILLIGVLIIGVFYGFVLGAHPAAKQDRLTKILEGMVDSVHAMRNPYKLVAESPYPKQSPKHSRPSSRREKVERSKPFVQTIDLRDTLEDDEKAKHKRG